jgi:hypothetical protein
MPTSPMEYLWPGIIAARAIHATGLLCVRDLLAIDRMARRPRREPVKRPAVSMRGNEEGWGGPAHARLAVI